MKARPLEQLLKRTIYSFSDVLHFLGSKYHVLSETINIRATAALLGRVESAGMP